MIFPIHFYIIIGNIYHNKSIDNLLALLDELSKSRILDEPETSDIAAFFDIFGNLPIHKYIYLLYKLIYLQDYISF